MLLADAIINVLRDLDLRYVFGVSGANIEHIHDAIYRLGKGRIRSVMTKSEYGAAFMADARARVHRTLGVCCSTSGGGMMNLAVGIAESYAQEVPVLALVGQPPLSMEGRGGFQDSSGKAGALDGEGFWNAIAKWVCKIDSPALFWAHLAKAITLPFEGRQGPAVMLLPRDMMTVDVGEKPSWFPQVLPNHSVPVISPDIVSDVWASIRKAKQPVFIMGSGVIRHGAEELACQLALETGITVVSTLASPGIFPNSLRNYLGMIGVAGHPSAHRYISEHSDLVIAVGTKLCAMTRGPLESVLADKELWLINGDSSEIAPSLCPSRIVETNLKALFLGLIELQSHFPLQKELPANANVTCFVPQKIDYSAHRIKHPAAQNGGLVQSEALHCLNHYLPEEGHIFFDAGNCAAAAAHFLKIPEGVSTTIALGMGGMGYAIAAAIGAQMGEIQEKRTIVFCGDGAFMMTGLEIHTAVDYQLPILWVVFNNNMHGMCVTRQHLMFGDRFEANVYSEINIMQIAKGFGDAEKIWTACATNLMELEAALADYISYHRRKPGVLELKIAQEEMPPFAPFLDKDSLFREAWTS